MRRMAGAHAAKVGPEAMTLSKALRTALAHGGDKAMKVAVGMRKFDQGVYLPDDLTEDLPETALFLMLRGSSGSTGVAITCPQVLGAIIEATTMGKVLERASPERAATRTDAALVSAFLAPVLETFGFLTARCEPPMPFSDYSTSTLLRDRRAALIVLADAAHVKITAEVDFAMGAKIGEITFILPQTRPVATPESPDHADWLSAIETVLLATPASMDAELCRLALPLADIRNLEVGQTLPLGNTSLDDVQLTGPNRAAIIGARLGRAGASRAVKLRSKPNGTKSNLLQDADFEAAEVANQQIPAAQTLDEPSMDTASIENSMAIEALVDAEANAENLIGDLAI